MDVDFAGEMVAVDGEVMVSIGESFRTVLEDLFGVFVGVFAGS